MKNSSSMKMLPVQNNYLFQDYYSNYYGTNNYQIVNNVQQPKVRRHESSLLFPVQNNLLNMAYQPQQKITKIQQVPKVEINLQNVQPKLIPMNSEPKIIRIQKKVYKRNPSLQLSPQKAMDYPRNFNRNLSINYTNYNNIYNFDGIKNEVPLTHIRSNNGFYSNNYEITSPIKNNSIASYNAQNPLEIYNYTSSKIENKFNNPNNSNIIYYTDYKKYNKQNLSNINNNENINYITDIIPNENDDIVNTISDTKINSSMNNLTSNYLVNSNNYITSGNINYAQPQSQKKINSIKHNLYNTYYSDINNNYIQTDINNTQNYNPVFSQKNKLSNSYSSSNFKLENNVSNYDNRNMNNQINLKPHNFIRSISSDNIKNHNRSWDNNQVNKNEFIPTKKIQNITIIKDPISFNNINDYKGNNYQNKQETSYIDSNPVKSNSSNNINNNYNINFNININHDYNNPNNPNNKYNINTPNNNYIPISFPELEPASNFNLSEFVNIGTVGRGTEGTIYAVKWKKNNKKYALKKGFIKMEEIVKKRQEEINMLKEFRKKTGSDGVINIYGYLCLRNKMNSYNYDFYELMELAEIDWDKEIERRSRVGQFYSEYELMEIMFQIVQTFALLQKNHITHRDIKPQNIILVNGKYKIIDFGNARILKRDGLVMQRIRGSEMYMSPVMFKAYHSKMERVKHNTFKSDVFSLGMCFLLAATLSYDPLNNIREEYNYSIITRYVRHYIGQRYSENIKRLLLHMLQVEEDLRPDFIQLEELFMKAHALYVNQ
jgi:hypothetical protein